MPRCVEHQLTCMARPFVQSYFIEGVGMLPTNETTPIGPVLSTAQIAKDMKTVFG